MSQADQATAVRRDVKHGEDAGYQKSLKNRQIQMIAIGGAIGTGLFLGAGGRLHSAGPALAIVYALAGLFAFIVVRAMGEMVMHRPTSGSFVSYAREFMGEKAAYTAGWLNFLNWAMSGIADVTAAAVYVAFFWPSVPQWIPSLIALALVVAVNLVSVKVFGEIEFWFAAIKVAALVVFMLVAIVVLVMRTPVDGHTTGPQLIFDNGGFFPAGFLAAVFILQGVVFAYAAIEMVGVAAGEAKEPHKVIPKAVNSVAWRIAVFYVGSIVLLAMVLPWTAYKEKQSPFVTFLSHIGVSAAAPIMNVVVLTAALSSVNSGLYVTGRLLRSMAHSGSAPKSLDKMSRSGVPYAGVALVAVVYLCGVLLNMVVPGRAFEIALEFSAVGIIGMWSMILLSHVFMVRKTQRGELERPKFRLPGAPYTNYVTLGFLLLVLVMTWFNTDDDGYPIGKVIVGGIPVIVLLLVGGWFLVRGNVTRIAAEHRAQREREQQGI